MRQLNIENTNMNLTKTRVKSAAVKKGDFKIVSVIWKSPAANDGLKIQTQVSKQQSGQPVLQSSL